MMHRFDILFLVPTLCHILWLLIGLAESDIIVRSPKTNETLNRFLDQPAAASFGLPFPHNGLLGHVVYTEPPDACEPIVQPPNTSNWIAVIAKSDNCSFHKQVSNAQKARFVAAIVHNNESDDLIEMSDSGRFRLSIPSTFIGLSSSHLLEQYNKRDDVIVFIIEPIGYDDEFILIILAAISSFSAFVVLCIVIGIGVHNCYRNRAQLLSRWKLKRLPLHTFKKGDLYENCAICLEEYNEGDKLRILPCAHAFHSKCIDVWLTKNKKTCPLCNETVNPKRRSSKKSRPESGSDNERTPLFQPTGDDDTIDEQIGTSDRSTNQSSVEIHPEPEPHASGHRSYGAAGISSISAVPGSSVQVPCPEETSLFAAGGVNTLGQSPLCHIEALPNCARFIPASEAEFTQQGHPNARDRKERHGKADGRTRRKHAKKVLISEKKSIDDSDNIV